MQQSLHTGLDEKDYGFTIGISMQSPCTGVRLLNYKKKWLIIICNPHVHGSDSKDYNEQGVLNMQSPHTGVRHPYFPTFPTISSYDFSNIFQKKIT